MAQEYSGTAFSTPPALTHHASYKGWRLPSCHSMAGNCSSPALILHLPSKLVKPANHPSASSTLRPRSPAPCTTLVLPMVTRSISSFMLLSVCTAQPSCIEQRSQYSAPQQLLAAHRLTSSSGRNAATVASKTPCTCRTTHSGLQPRAPGCPKSFLCRRPTEWTLPHYTAYWPPLPHLLDVQPGALGGRGPPQDSARVRVHIQALQAARQAGRTPSCAATACTEAVMPQWTSLLGHPTAYNFSRPPQVKFNRWHDFTSRQGN
jgi:hypothetical protein